MNTQKLSISELEELIREYPWFAYARYALLCKLAEKGRECFASGVRSSLILLPNREALLSSIVSRYGLDPVAKVSSIAPETAEEETPTVAPFDMGFLEVEFAEAPSGRERAYVAGGDYFSKEDFESLKTKQENITLNYANGSFTAERGGDAGVADSESVNEGFYTETLAAIYAQQGYYQQAIEVYSKLCLLYPEKSAYFASLAKEIKNKN